MSVDPTRRPLRIAVVTETYPPEVNGVARTIGVMVASLRERQHSIQLVRPRQADEPPAHRKAPPEAGLETLLRRGLPLPRYPALRMGVPSKRVLLAAWRARRPIYPATAWLVLPFAALVATSRLVLGLHYPTDVLAGAAIGSVLALGSLAFL